jgi:hypothetical protein
MQSHAETARSLAQRSTLLEAEFNRKAVIVFTIVNINSLPLITSCLGVNTSYLHELDSGQGLSWAIGTSVAFVTFRVAKFTKLPSLTA